MASTTTAVSTGSCPASSSAPATQVLLRFIEEMTTNVDAVQERVLAEILGRNADSEYLAKCDLAGGASTDRATFRAKVPMVTYEDLKPYIMRIADGDSSPILSGSAHPISEFFPSSGTSAGGQLKLIPSVKDEFDRRQLLYSLIMPVMSQFVPGIEEGKGLYFLFVRPEMKTAGGLPARPVLTAYYKSDHFKNHACHTYTSPMAAILCEDTFQSMYAQMVCGLCQRHAVVRVGAVFAAGLLRAILFLQQHWEQLAADVEAGELSVSDPSVRAAVAAAGILQAPDPELAMAIRAECGHGDWAGIVTRVWPNAKCLDTIVTGSMAQYVPALNFYSGDLPIASTKYVSSECPIGLNLRHTCDDDPSEVPYTIMPNMAYFEFLPADDFAAAAGGDKLVELAGVEAGREYELVVTTYGGLSRYRVGDVLRVTGFHNAAPEFAFARRSNVVLSIDADKTDEAELQRAVDRAAALLRHRRHGAAVLDYTSRTCAETIPGHYVVYWELLLETHAIMDDDMDVLPSCCLEMEEALSYVYRVLRVKDGTIGPLEIRIVRSGTFVDLADYAVSHGGASMAQYKVPRSVTAPAIVQLLDSRVVSRHFSPGLPHWEPVHHFELDRDNGEEGSA